MNDECESATLSVQSTYDYTITCSDMSLDNSMLNFFFLVPEWRTNLLFVIFIIRSAGQRSTRRLKLVSTNWVSMMMRDMQPIERYTGQIKGGLILGNNLVILIHLCGSHLPPPHIAPN